MFWTVVSFEKCNQSTTSSIKVLVLWQNSFTLLKNKTKLLQINQSREMIALITNASVDYQCRRIQSRFYDLLELYLTNHTNKIIAFYLLHFVIFPISNIRENLLTWPSTYKNQNALNYFDALIFCWIIIANLIFLF